MSTHCVEVLKFVATDAFRADHTVSYPSLEIVSRCPGALSIYIGLESQEPEYGYLAVVWESIQYHQDVMDDKELQGSIIGKAGASMVSMVYLDHVTFTAEPDIALSAPITEFAIWTLKETTDTEHFQNILAKLVALISSLPPSSGVYKGGWGTVVENQRQFMVLLGWESLEVFAQTVSGSREAQELVGQLKELADLDLKHATFTKYLGPK